MTDLVDYQKGIGSSQENMFTIGVTISGVHPFFIIGIWPGFPERKIFPADIFVQKINFFHKTNTSNL
jgi:hypothetical protein